MNFNIENLTSEPVLLASDRANKELVSPDFFLKSYRLI